MQAAWMDGSLGKYIITFVTVNISVVPRTVILSGYFTGQWSARIHDTSANNNTTISDQSLSVL